jgi:Zn-dependent M28 family amino/carboxypeptidase
MNLYKSSFYWAFFIALIAVVGCQSEQSSTNSQSISKISKIQQDISADTIKSSITKLSSFYTRHTTSDTGNDTAGIGAARRWIHDKFISYRKRSDNRLKVHYERYRVNENSSMDSAAEVVNVVAVLPGKQLESKERTYIVSGHYDSRVSDIMDDSSYAPGANDNASGTAAVMELARVMSKFEFDATLIFMATAGKEQGLWGAKKYAEIAKRRNIDIDAVINNDVIGSTQSASKTENKFSVRVFSQGIPPGKRLTDYHRMLIYNGGENDTPSRQLGRYIYRIGNQHAESLSVNMVYRRDRFLRKGDHLAFLEQGYPAVRITEDHESVKRQHQYVRTENGTQYGDLPRFINYQYVSEVTRLNAATLSSLANAPARPNDVGIMVQEATSNSTLRWKANAEPDIKGYEIVWRQSHDPYWQHSKFVGDTTRYTIEGVSKNSYIFGVRTVDTFGYKSPAVYPYPVR